MTERLTDLLQRAADDLSVPQPPTKAILDQGRRGRRRHRLLATAAGVGAVVAVSGGLVAVTVPKHHQHGPTHVASEVATRYVGATFSVGTTVYLDDGRLSAPIADKAIKSLYYTSAGVLVRHGNNNQSDGGGPMRFSLVTPDGLVHPLAVTFEETVPSTDPSQPYLAWADDDGGVVHVNVIDVRDGSEVAKVAVPDATSWGGWTAPPVSLDGDDVYVGTDDVMRVVDWRTGAVSTTDAIAPGFPDVQGGHAVVYAQEHVRVADVATGTTLVDAGASDIGLRLSPDGAYALAQSYGLPGTNDDATYVYDVASGRKVELPPTDNTTWGWGPDDSIFLVTPGSLTTCAPDSGQCTTAALSMPVDKDTLRLGGVTYES